jgi:hypothetical protein
MPFCASACRLLPKFDSRVSATAPAGELAGSTGLKCLARLAAVVRNLCRQRLQLSVVCQLAMIMLMLSAAPPSVLWLVTAARPP